jgi:PAS domain S-box-containing protein
MVDRIKQLLAPPVFPDDEDKTRAATLLNALLLAILALLTFNTLRALIFEFDPMGFALNAINLPLVVGLYVALRRGYVRASGTITVVAFWLVVTAISAGVTGFNVIILSAYYVLVFLAGVLMSRRASIVFLVLSIVAGILVFLRAENTDWIPNTGNALANNIAALSLLVVMTVALYLMLKNLDEALGKLRQNQRELEQAQATLEERVAQRTRDLNLASEGARSIAQIRDVNELLTTAVEIVHAYFDLYYTQVYLLDEANNRLVLRAGTGAVGQQLLAQGHFLPLDSRSISGTAVFQQRPVLAADTATDPFFRPNPLLPDNRAELAVPLMLGERVLGVLDMQSTQTNTFTADSIPAFETLAGQLAIALDNAQLLAAQRETAVSLQQALAATEAQAQRFAILNDIGAAFSTAKDANELFFIVSRQILHLLPGDRATIALLEANSQTFEVLALEGDNNAVPVGARLPVAGTAVGLAIQQNRFLRLPQDMPLTDFADSARLASLGLKGFMIMPLSIAGEVIGTLNIASKEGTPYSKTDIGIFQQVATQLSAALEGRRLNERIGRLAAIVENHPDLIGISTLDGYLLYLNTAGAQMLNLADDQPAAGHALAEFMAETDVQTLLDVGVPTALETGVWSADIVLKTAVGAALPVEYTIAIHYDTDGKALSFSITMHDMTDRKQAEESQRQLTSQLEERLTQLNVLQRAMTREGWSAFMTATDRLVQGYMFEDESLRLLSRRDLQKATVPSLPEGVGETAVASDALAMPIAVRGETIGVLGLRHPAGESLTPQQQKLLAAVSQQVAEALERARLFEEMELARAQTDALYAGSARVIQATSLDDVLEALVGYTSLKQMDRVDLVLFNQPWRSAPPSSLHIIATWSREGFVTAVPLDRTLKLSLFPFITGQQRYAPFVCTDLANDERMEAHTRHLINRATGARSFLMFPLVTGDQWIGLVVAQSTAVQNLPDRDIRQITSLVSQAATVTQTQRLFSEAQQRAHREQVLREIGSRVYAAADVETILRTAAREVHQALGLETFIYLEEAEKVG